MVITTVNAHAEETAQVWVNSSMVIDDPTVGCRGNVIIIVENNERTGYQFSQCDACSELQSGESLHVWRLKAD